MRDRWQQYDPPPIEVADGWSFEPLTPPSRLFGANGMAIGPDGRLYVTQGLGSQVTAIDVDTGAHELVVPMDRGVVTPDDGAFTADGTLYVTEQRIGRVSARNPDGTHRIVREDVPAANGIATDHAGRRLFVDEFRPGGRLLEIDPLGAAEPRVLLEDLAGPNGLAVGPDGRLWFPQVFAGQLWACDPDSGAAELVADGLEVPTAVKVDARGRIVVAECRAGRITAIDPATGDRTTLAEVPTGIDNLVVGPDDRLFVSHFVDGRVTEETGGRSRLLSEPGFVGPTGLAVTSGGGILVAEVFGVASLDRGGTVTRVLTLFVDLAVPTAAVAEVDGELVVLALTGEVLRVPGGSTGLRTVAAGLEDPTSLLAERTGGLLVTERVPGRVTRVHLDGRTEVVASGLRMPSAVAVDDAGTLFVTEAGAGSVVEIDPSGGSRPLVTGLGMPQGIARSGGTLLVADVASHELVIVDVATGRATVAVAGAPVGPPVPGALPLAFAPVAPDPEGGFLVGCDGDGSIRRLRRRP